MVQRDSMGEQQILGWKRLGERTQRKAWLGTSWPCVPRSAAVSVQSRGDISYGRGYYEAKGRP